MPRSERAKQFAPFDALKGLQKALRLKEYEHDRIIKGDINEEMADKISNNLLKVKKNDMIYVKYYEDGYYKELQSKLKKLEIAKNQIEIERKVINLSDIFDLDILNSN